MRLDHEADRAVYKQLADLIRTQIHNGGYVPGQRLPAQKDYMQEHGVSRDTVDRAMAVLRSEGLIVTDRKGSRVRLQHPRRIVHLDHGTISARAATAHERRHFGIAEGIPLLVIERDGHSPDLFPADRVVIHIGTDTDVDDSPVSFD